MTDQSHSTAGTNLVAIDIAKEWNVVLVQEASGQKRNFKVANNAADHNQLLLYLTSLPGRTRIAFEPTGEFRKPASKLFRFRQWPKRGFGKLVMALGTRTTRKTRE